MPHTHAPASRSLSARFAAKAQGMFLPGLGGASVYEVGKCFFDGLKTSRLQERAAAVTYNFLMAMPPTFLILFSLVPYLPLDNVEQTVLNIIKLLSPNKNIYNNVHNIVLDFMNTRHHDVLSYGIILVFYFSSNGVMGLMRSFDRSSPVHIKRTAWQRRWIAVELTAIIIGVVILGIASLIYQRTDINPLIHRNFSGWITVKTLSFIILSLLVFVTISIIYTYGPSLKHRFRFISAGSVFATIGIIIASSIFFFLVNNFINYNRVYGSIGTLIAFMVWVWLNTTIILLGYELNVSILLGKLSKQEESVAQQNTQQ
jgi:membrane protein